jgi:TetR/AcrR family transcriptional regulator
MVEAALQLIKQDGLASFTVQDVLSRADVSLQTFYRHFSSKDEFLLAVLEETVAHGSARYREDTAKCEHPLDRVECIVKGPLLHHLEQPITATAAREHLRLNAGYAREVREADEPYYQLLRDSIVAAQAAGWFVDIDPDEEAEMIMAVVRSQYHNVLLGVVSRPVNEEANHLWQFVRGALVRNDNPPVARLRAAP